MKYIVASDFDGTLIQNGVVNDKTVNAIKKLQKQGHFFGVVTGRDYVMGYEVFKKFDLFPFDFVITHNGASACDKDGNIYFSEFIKGGEVRGKSTLAQELIERCMELSSDSCGIAFNKTRLDFHPDFPDGGKGKDREYSAHSALKDVTDFVLANVVCKTADAAFEVTEKLKTEFGDVLNPLQNGRCIDISAVGVDKSHGIKKLAEHLCVSTDCIWTAGDNYNDIPMIKAFHGCAMSDGVKDLKDIAEYVCDDVGEVIEIILKQHI